MSSCTPANSVKKVNDRAKNKHILTYTNQQSHKSNIYNVVRTFKFTLNRYSDNPDRVFLSIQSHYPITQPDYNDSIYMVFNKVTKGYMLNIVVENVQYQEQNNRIRSTNSIETSTETRIEKGDSNKNYTKERPNEDVVRTRTTESRTQVDVSSTILDKLYSHKQIEIPASDFKYFFNTETIYIQVYDTAGDFWKIPIQYPILRQWRKIITNKFDVEKD